MMNCELCETKALLLENGAYELYRCPKCGFVFKKEVQVDYRQLDEDRYRVYNFDRSKEAKEIVNAVRKFRPRFEGMNLVEIGCGTGALLTEFKKYGLGVYGYEPSEVAAKMALERFGLDTVVNGFFEELDKKINPDFFLAYDLIEHLSAKDVLDLFMKIHASMNRDSLLIVKSGDVASWNANLYLKKWRYIQIHQHVSFFTRKSLQILCNEAGLNLMVYQRLRHAYGGINYGGILRNLIKAFLNRSIKRLRTSDRFSIELANDHFIAILSRI